MLTNAKSDNLVFDHKPKFDREITQSYALESISGFVMNIKTLNEGDYFRVQEGQPAYGVR